MQPVSSEGPVTLESDKEAVIQMLEENEGYRKIVKMILEGGDEEYGMQCFRAELREKSGLDASQMKGLECGVRWAVEARRKGRSDEQEQWRQGEQAQYSGLEQSKQGKQVRFGDEEQFEEVRTESGDKLEETDGLAEVRTGRGSAGLVRGGDEGFWADETSRKGKGKGNGGKGEHGGKGEGFGSKGKQQETREGGRKRTTEDEQQRNEEKEEILRLLGEWQERETSPIVKSAWADETEVESTEQVENLVADEDRENIRAMTSEEKEKRHKEDVRKLDEMVETEEMELKMMQQEEMEHEEQRGRVAPNMGAGGSHLQATSDPREEETEERRKRARRPRWADCEDDEGKEKETRPRELTSEKPPGLEQWVKSEHEEGDEEQRKAQEAREEERTAQKAREEERSAQEAREEQRRAQEVPEQRKAQEEQEREAEAQQEQEKEVSAQSVREGQAREGKAQKRGVDAQEGHGEEMTTQEKCVEAKNESNSMHEENDVSSRHMTWWRDAWWVRMDNGPHLRTARDRRRVWRAATRAAREARETERVAGREREKWEQGATGRKESNTLHVVFHFPSNGNETATATSATTTAVAATTAAAIPQHQ